MFYDFVKSIPQGLGITNQLEGLYSYTNSNTLLGNQCTLTTTNLCDEISLGLNSQSGIARTGGNTALSGQRPLRITKGLNTRNSIKANMGVAKTYEDFSKFADSPRQEAVYLSASKIGRKD